jgi:hypothetical protein
MARIRTVKPTLLRHRQLFLVEKKSKMPMRIAYVGLFTCADRDGKFKWEPQELKLDCLPYDAVDFEKVLDILKDSGFIIKYEVEGKYYGLIPTFKDHQRIKSDEAKSTIPDPQKTTTRDEPARTVVEPDTNPHRGKEGKGSEYGKEGKGDANTDDPKKIDLVEKEEEPPDLAPPPQIIYPFDTESFKLIWANWILYRWDEFKKKYKTPQSEQAALSHVANLSEGNEALAIEIVKQSMSNQWQGLFELKTNGRTNQNHTSYGKQGASGGYFARKYGGDQG